MTCRDHNEEYSGDEAVEESEISGWVELCDEVPDDVEMDYSANEDVDWNSPEPREMIKEEHRDGVGEVDSPCSGPDNIKLGGWIYWCQQPVYPQCPDCNTGTTAPLLMLGESDKLLNHWVDGYAHVTLCPKCQHPGLGWEA